MNGAARCDLLVVGAGPAGSSLAAAAAGAGMQVILVEAARHPRPKACAEYASPRIADELDRLGVPSVAWQAAARPLRGMRVVAGDAEVEIGYADRRGARPAWGLDRQRFDGLLASHAARAGAQVIEESAVVQLLHDRSRVAGALIRDRSGGLHELRGAWVAGADGARSKTARLVGAEARLRFPRRLGLVAHYASTAALHDHGEMHVGGGYYVGLAPVPGGELNVGMALPMDGDGRSAAARFDAAIAGLPRVAEQLLDSRRLTPIRGAAPIGHRVRDVAGAGWLLVGDAAGFVDPFTGEGIYRALRSSRAALAALLAAQQDREVATRYRAERRAAFAAKDALTWLVQGMLAAPPLLGYALRRLGDRHAAALRFGSALGDCRPASDAFALPFVFEVLRP